MRSTFATGSLLAALVVVLFLPGLTLHSVVEATAPAVAPEPRELPADSETGAWTVGGRAAWRESEWLRPALASLRTAQWEDALTIVGACEMPSDADEQGRADFLRGLLLLRTGHADQAVELLEAATRWADDSGSSLRARAWFHLGEAHEALGHGQLAARGFGEAAAASDEAAGSSTHGPGHVAGALAPWARLREGQALSSLGETTAALAALRPLVLAPHPGEAPPLPPTGRGRAANSADLKERVELRLTALAEALPLAEARDGVLAAKIRRALLVEFPCSQSARTIASTGPLATAASRLTLLGPKDMLARCDALVGDTCEAEAIEDLAVIFASKASPEITDHAELLMGRALRSDGQAKKAIEHFRRVGLSDPEILSRATWEWAAANKTLNKKSDHRRLLRACAEGAVSPWRDKAALLLAEEESDAGRLASARELWRRVAADSPDDALRVQAAWRAAWSQYRAGLESAALASFESIAQSSPTRREAAAARYWAARIVGKRGQVEDASARLLSLAADFPRDYYGIVAAEEAGQAPPEGDGCVAASLEQAQATGLARLGRVDATTASVATELLRLGLVDDALEELRHARVADDAGAALARDEVRTVALAIAGRRAAALRTFRESVPDWRTRADLSSTVWCAVYPLDYDNIVLANCAERGLDPALVCGLIHQESVFESTAVSWVGARGLMQVMPATGRTIARWFDESITTPRLVEPELNVRYGTEYLARLLDEFGHPELALAGYNAGGGRARRWWKQVGGQDVPLFVESIPFEETREYVKAIAWSSRLYRSAWDGALDQRAAVTPAVHAADAGSPVRPGPTTRER